MEQKNMRCEGCSRGCGITLTEKNGKYYLQGNTCAIGEQKAKDHWIFLKDKELILGKVEEKKSLLKRFLGK